MCCVYTRSWYIESIKYLDAWSLTSPWHMYRICIGYRGVWYLCVYSCMALIFCGMELVWYLCVGHLSLWSLWNKCCYITCAVWLSKTNFSCWRQSGSLTSFITVQGVTTSLLYWLHLKIPLCPAHTITHLGACIHANTE